MIKSRDPKPQILCPILVFAVVVAVSATTFASAEQPNDSRLLKVLARQKKKGDELSVYLRDARRVYINGTQIPVTLLTTIVTRSGVTRATISAEPFVSSKRVNEVRQAISNGGVKAIMLTAPKQAEGAEATVLKVLARQKKKGDTLNVYLRDARRVYVNGTQISLKLLATIVTKSGVAHVTITMEPFVSRKRVNEIRQLIRKAGVKDRDIALSGPSQTDGAGEKFLKILARQKRQGDQLNVYLKNSKGLYVNGTQISLKELAKVVSKMTLARASITAEPVVSPKRVEEVRQVISKAGVNEIKLTPPKTK